MATSLELTVLFSTKLSRNIQVDRFRMAEKNLPTTYGKAILVGVIAVTAATAGLVVYMLTRPPKISKSTPPLKAEVKDLTKDEVCKILQEITVGVQQVIMQLANEERQIMSTAGAQKLTPEQLQGYLLKRFQESVAEVEKKTYKDNNVDEESIKIASEKYETDPDVKRAVQQLKSVYGAVMGGNPADLPPVPDFLTQEKTLLILEDTMKVLRDEAQTVIAHLKSIGIEREKDQSKYQVEFQKLYGKQVEESRKKLYEKNGINDDLLIQAAVVKYQGDPSFQHQLKESSDKHNKLMGSLGLFAQQPKSS